MSESKHKLDLASIRVNELGELIRGRQVMDVLTQEGQDIFRVLLAEIEERGVVIAAQERTISNLRGALDQATEGAGILEASGDWFIYGRPLKEQEDLIAYLEFRFPGLRSAAAESEESQHA